MKVIGVIPARYASTRLPAKPLAPICGKPLVQWVWEAASKASTLSQVLVATDDERISSLVQSFGGTAVMTSPECPSGTDRIAEAVRGADADIVVNIQGDEPLMATANIDACVNALASCRDAAVSTPMVPLTEPADFTMTSVVKVVHDSRGFALYFSRAPIPDRSRVTPGGADDIAPIAMKHLGLYVYRREAIEAFVKLPPSRYETLEKLEQLRFLEAGYRILMVEVASDSIGVDTPADVATVEAIMRAKGIAT